ncbi:MAG: cytochrome c [Woeseiaceae bacterium]
MFGVKTILSITVVAIIAGFMFIWFGVFNVSASDKHWAITNNFLELVRDRSISARAENLKVPNLTDTARINRGAANYDAMCVQCHLAPGVDTSELYEGLNPKPPVLYKSTHFANKPNETFWVIKHGIKMTGMPEWGLNNSDEQIWDMIALVSALDNMTATQYKELVASGEHTHKGGAAHEDSSHDELEMGSHKDESGVHHSKPASKKISEHDKNPHAH